jgi:glycosyltransferase involved in cell wall biosynthesis
MKEIAEKVAILVDPQNPLSIKNAIVKIINDNKLTKKLIGLGVKHVKKFNWENTAKKTIEVYKNIHSQNL